MRLVDDITQKLQQSETWLKGRLGADAFNDNLSEEMQNSIFEYFPNMTREALFTNEPRKTKKDAGRNIPKRSALRHKR